MLIHVREGKTGLRDVMLSPRILVALRTHWKSAVLPALGTSQNPRVLLQARLLAGAEPWRDSIVQPPPISWARRLSLALEPPEIYQMTPSGIVQSALQ
jgi:hypothetical protein